MNVGHPSEVDEIFDAISYSKGASVIRMLHNYIGDEVRGRAHTVREPTLCAFLSPESNVRRSHRRTLGKG